MNKINQLRKRGTTVMDQSDHSSENEQIFPAIDTLEHAATRSESGTVPTAKELQALFEASAKRELPQASTTDSEVPPPDTRVQPAPIAGDASAQIRTGPRRATWLALVGVVILFAASLALYSYLKNRPTPVPAPSSAGFSSTGTETTTNAMPETAFRISPEKQQLIGVQYGTVENESLSKSLRAVGRAAFDETRIVRINPKIEGWIEDVYVDFTGKLVQKGQPLLNLYSPDLVQTQEEYLLAIKGRKQLGESPFNEAVNFSESLVQSARRRLELWDVTDAQIKELEKRGTPSRTMTLYAPSSGFVMTRNAFPKQRVMPDTELYQLADLSTIWIIADIYEFEAADIKLGQHATVTLASYPGRNFSGKITYIYPQVDNITRTLRVRVELANKDFLLKPDMFADVTLNIGYGNRLVVPQEAVMDSGLDQVVYVSLGDGYFEPRKIQVGAKVENKYVVISGLKAGERVVTSGNFLVDSESKLQSAAAGMGMPGMDHGHSKPKQQTAPPAIDHSQHKPGQRHLEHD